MLACPASMPPDAKVTQVSNAMQLHASAAAGRREAHDILVTMLLAGVLLAGAALRLHGLDRTSIFNDEASSWAIARLPFMGMLRATAEDVHPPLYHAILYVTIRLFGDSETALRLPSAIMGIANIYLIYRLGAVLWDRLTSVFASALLAFAAFHIWYSQEARMYALLCLLATACALTTVLLFRRPSWPRAALCGVTSTALLYSHVYGAFDWASINLALGLAMIAGGGRAGDRSEGKAAGRLWLAAQAFAILCFLPWAFVLQYQVHSVMSGFWVPFPTLHFL